MRVGDDSHPPNENKFQCLKPCHTWETMKEKPWIFFLLVFSSFSLTSWYPAYPGWLRPPRGACLYILVRVSCCFCLLNSPSCSSPLYDHTESSVFVHQHSLPWNPACLFRVTQGLIKGRPHGGCWMMRRVQFRSSLQGGRGNLFLHRAHQTLHSFFVNTTLFPGHHF